MMRMLMSGLVLGLLSLFSWAYADMATSANFEIPDQEQWLETLGKSFDLGFSVGHVVYRAPDGTTESIPKVSARPRFSFSGFNAGINLNLLLTDNEVKEKLGDTAKNEFIVEYVSYKKKNFLARWGAINGMTLGQGLIMNNYYSTARSTSAVYSNDDKAALLDIKSKVGFTGIWTQTDIVGGRLSYHFGSKRRGVTVGATYLTDTDQKTTKGNSLSIYGVDAFFPLFGRKTGIGVEWAKIQDYGNGFSAGLQLGGNSIRWTNGYRSFDKDFQPSIFDSHYEATMEGNVIAPTANNSENGFLSKLDIFLPIPSSGEAEGTIRLTGAYEDYEKTEPRVIAEGYAKITGGSGYLKNLRAKVTYEEQNFRINSATPRSSVAKGELQMPLNDNLDLILTYTKTTDKNGNSVDGFNTDFAFHF